MCPVTVGNQSSEHTLANIIQTMPQDKITNLVKILTDTTISRHDFREAYTSLYSPGEKGYVAFQRFLRTHGVPSLLGGVNNLNYKVTQIDPLTGMETSLKPWVLKVEVLFNQPKIMANKLRNEELIPLTNVYSEREITWIDGGDPVTRTLVVTDFCDGGDLHTYIQKLDPKEKIKSVLPLYIQMADILETIRQHEGLFADMKNINWLIMRKSKALYISDIKGFLPAKQGVCKEADHDKLLYCLLLLQTTAMSPPEFDEDGYNFSVDKAHAYILGKNLYQALTGDATQDLRRIRDITDQDFDHPIFRTKTGISMKQLIQNLIKKNPEERLTVAQALSYLRELHLQHQLTDLFKTREAAIKTQSQLRSTLAEKKVTPESEQNQGLEVKEKP